MDDYNALIVREHHDLLAAISTCEKQKREIDKQEKAMRELLLKAMEDKDLWDITFEEGDLEVTRIAPTTQNRIDTDRLRAELPLIADEYTKIVDVKGSIRFNLKKKKEKA